VLQIIGLFLSSILHCFRTRGSMFLENVVLRQQLAIFKRKHARPRLKLLDKLLWILARRFWSGSKQALILVSPETVVRWHRAGFALYWKTISRVRRAVGRKRITKEGRDLIFRMAAEDPTWGAARIHGELLMLGFDAAERTMSRWMRRAPRTPEPAKRWRAFLGNHREAIAAMDFFTVPTIAFGVLCCFFVIGRNRRRILHFSVTRLPTSA
jgi:putative transposase